MVFGNFWDSNFWVLGVFGSRILRCLVILGIEFYGFWQSLGVEFLGFGIFWESNFDVFGNFANRQLAGLWFFLPSFDYIVRLAIVLYKGAKTKNTTHLE